MISPADLRFFAAIAATRSLAAAARELDVTPSAVTQRLQQLERRLGVRLVDRSGRKVTLTDEGETLVARGREILDDLTELGERLVARRRTVAGHLRVLAPPGFGRQHVVPAVSRLAAEHPGLTVELTLSDRLGRIPDTAWDVAVHIGTLHDSTLIAELLAPNERFVCAAPSYVKRAGAPRTPADLREHACIAIRENEDDATLWRFQRDGRPAEQVRIRPVLATNDGEVAREWALRGHGIVVRSEWSVADDLRAGRLVRLLDGHALAPANVVALVRKPQGRSARVSALLEVLHEGLRPVPWRDRRLHE
jgi:DNA-binding transcriptional LysR family regulator